ncbi:type II secretion system GspH family protein [Candidatus Woesebacteria bacterium]|nr:type II secretion system GspH family protein [Candidatus Woesebacteria bacterium]MCD8507244.1 type II secretion system GspH family protein [Candidatus Woesebacteria bacterium]MCD8526621.1 type II secretion system GspH family protein [Candidatus Woesebacteria bacterium]MCD8546017.1 type II secretion system GspH family protein [Candidatus Woesebacteria bacterium]
MTLPRQLLSHMRNVAGFTMIELLVVISVIGILAVAVLSSINPIEQINKGRDTRTRSDAAQLINAVDRYFSIHEEYPWNTETADWAGADVVDDYETGIGFYEDEAVTFPGSTTTLSSWEWINILETTAEVKAGFVNRLTTDDNVDYVIYKPDTANATMYICFPPSSNAFDQEASARCTGGSIDDDVQSIACPANCDDSFTDNNACLVCLP